MRKVEFFIPGIPVPKARPKGQLKGRGGKSYIHIYTPSKSGRWEKRVSVFARVAKRKNPVFFEDCPLRMNVTFYFPRPKSHTKKQQECPWHFRKPDRDNLEKSISDALEGIFFKNDSQICDGTPRKMYVEDRAGVGVKVEIEEII